VRWIGHSGLAAGRPGGTPTRQTLAEAARLHLDWLEVDVCRTSEGILVLRHDLLLPSRRALRTVTLADARREDPDLLTLEEGAEVIREGGVPAMVDLKDARDAELVVAWLAAQPDPDRWAICTDDVIALQGARAKAGRVARWRTLPQVPPGRGESARRILACVLRSTLPARVPALAAEVDAAALSVDRWALTPRLCAAAHALGLPVAAWTLNNPAGVPALQAAGVDFVTTDRPAAMRPQPESQDSAATARCDG
jgi:glycerophosphoryl diester phosphodiesterase